MQTLPLSTPSVATEVPPALIAPFAALILLIAVMPLAPHRLKHLWERWYPAVAIGLGGLVALWYLAFQPHGPAEVLGVLREATRRPRQRSELSRARGQERPRRSGRPGDGAEREARRADAKPSAQAFDPIPNRGRQNARLQPGRAHGFAQRGGHAAPLNPTKEGEPLTPDRARPVSRAQRGCTPALYRTEQREGGSRGHDSRAGLAWPVPAGDHVWGEFKTNKM